MPDTVVLTIHNQPGEVGRLLDCWEELGADRNIPAEPLAQISLALDEVATNVISYAWADGAAHEFKVILEFLCDRVTIAVDDDGIAFDPLSAPAPDVEADLDERGIGGLGIHLVLSLMDEVSYRRSGGHNVLTISKSLPGAPAETP